MEEFALRLKVGLRHSRLKGPLRAAHQRYRRLHTAWYVRRHQQPASVTPVAPVGDPYALATSLEARGYPVRRLRVDLAAFAAFLEAAAVPEEVYAGIYRGKLLEHYLSLVELAPLRRTSPGGILIDIAAHGSPFAEVAHRLAGFTTYRQDLLFPEGAHGDRIGGDAAKMPLVEGTVDALTLHNSLEHFELDSDVRFIREAARVLCPGGRVVVVPLDLGERYLIRTDPTLRRPGLSFAADPGARIVEQPGLGQRHERFYDVDTLIQRVLTVSPALIPHLGLVENAAEAGGFPRPIFLLTLERRDD